MLALADSGPSQRYYRSVSYLYFLAIYIGQSPIIIAKRLSEESGGPSDPHWVNQVRFEDRAHAYDGLPVFSAMGMALFEASGLAEGLSEALGRPFGNRCLTPVNAVKAMIGPVFDGRGKMALHSISTFYTDAPTEELFGTERISLHDNAFGRALDTLAGLDHSETLWSLSEGLERRFQLGSNTFHIDTTNLAVYCLEKDYDNEPVVPAYCGDSKEGRPDLLHYAFLAVTDSDGILRYLEPYNANLSDSEMNHRAVGFLKDRVDRSETILVADSKLASVGLVGSILSMGMGFVTRCPEQFGESAQSRAKSAALEGGLRPSHTKNGKMAGWEFFDTMLPTDKECGELRFVVYRTPARLKKSYEGLKRSGGRRVEALTESLRAKKFDSEEKASAIAEAAISSLDAPAYDVRYVIKPDRDNKHNLTGKWRIAILSDFDEEACRTQAERRSLMALVTNLPMSDEDCENLREGATAEAVASLYAGWKSRRFGTRPWRIVFSVITVLISLSTVFLKQHSALDVFAALPLCALGWWVAELRIPKKKFADAR